MSLSDEIWFNDGNSIWRNDEKGNSRVCLKIDSPERLNLIKAAPRLLKMCEMLSYSNEDNVLLREVIEFAKTGKTNEK